jgi:hypothetical protein
MQVADRFHLTLNLTQAVEGSVAMGSGAAEGWRLATPHPLILNGDRAIEGYLHSFNRQVPTWYELNREQTNPTCQWGVISFRL